MRCITVKKVTAIYVLNMAIRGLLCADGCSGDKQKSFSTSVEAMVPLLELERLLIQNLADYADELEKKLNIVRSGVATMRIENSKSMEDPQKYLSNPLNSFPFMRRMHEDWTSWETFMAEPVGTAQIIQMKRLRPDMPTSPDLAEAALGMLSLQTIYDLDPLDMVNGLLQGRQYNERLSALDSFAVGRELMKADQFFFAGFWLYAAIEIYNENALHDIYDFSRLKIMEFFAVCLLEQNRLTDALGVINLGLNESPHNSKLLGYKEDAELLLQSGHIEPKIPRLVDYTHFELGCRGEFQDSPSRLHCRYNTTTSAFLKLAPLKMEEVHLDPYMVLFHDVISDNEIAELKKMAAPVLERARVQSTNLSVEVDERRSSQVAWFPNTKSNATIRLNRRIADMTGFRLRGSEFLQVMNYGLGGRYLPHFDYLNLPPPEDVLHVQGDRISTVLFYMNNVELGGATVFPNIRKAIFPRKGSAVVWYNLNNKGEGNPMTLHGACPVIVGSKWVCTKWIRERNQVFTKPCYPE